MKTERAYRRMNPPLAHMGQAMENARKQYIFDFKRSWRVSKTDKPLVNIIKLRGRVNRSTRDLFWGTTSICIVCFNEDVNLVEMKSYYISPVCPSFQGLLFLPKERESVQGCCFSK